MALRCRSHVVGAELFAHGEVAPRRLEDKREREMTPVVLTSTAMVMAEAVASEKLGGVGFRRRRQTPAAGAVGSCIEEEAPLDVGWRPVVSRAAADLTGRVSETMTAGSRTPCAAASGPKWFSAAARLNDEACSSGAWWSGRKRCGAAAPALAPPLLELELSQTVSAPPKLGVEMGGAVSQNELELWSWV
ncbi:hypothetical protein OsJ_35461 [Oryza sativa Japonica Group]|uniref:Uncharacterized protein n=1 Tax=Oryza sativa subsp. japonica TaxID=39947 RepID=A3CFL4_ORYSJ|nr:hypothetical protein OsJ_35461 [Oryza sativa Japonica Group]